MKKITIFASMAVLATLAFLTFGGPQALAQGIQTQVQAQKSQIWAQKKGPWELNDHHFGVGIEVYNPTLGANFDRKVRYLDLGQVENLHENVSPVSATAVVNGHPHNFQVNAQGQLELTIPASELDGLGPNDITIVGFGPQGQELATFELGGCYFL